MRPRGGAKAIREIREGGRIHPAEEALLSSSRCPLDVLHSALVSVDCTSNFLSQSASLRGRSLVGTLRVPSEVLRRDLEVMFRPFVELGRVSASTMLRNSC